MGSFEIRPRLYLLESVQLTELLWPVPSRGECSILLKAGASRATYQVFHLTGQVVATGSLQADTPQKLQLDGQGMYVLQIFSADSGQVLHTRKLSVQ